MEMWTDVHTTLPDGANESQIATAADIIAKEPVWKTFPWLAHGCIVLFFPNPGGPEYSYRSSVIRPDGSVGGIIDLLGNQTGVKIK
jgi:hypothetical protein